MRRILVVLLALLGGCAPRLAAGPPRVETLEAAGLRFHLVYPPEEAASARLVAEALPEAVARASRYAALRVPVTIAIHGSQEALEAAAGRPGRGWLRAWARFATIELRSPRAWSLFGAGRDEVVALLAHELAHCAMYQAAGADRAPASSDPPLWFREGLASVSAGEGAKRIGLPALRAFYLEARGTGPAAGDPLTDPEPILARDPDLVYGAAHHAFSFLVARYGEARVRVLLRHMAGGRPFPAAFREATGLEAAAFEAEFRRYVVWRGWAGAAGYSSPRRTTEAMAQSLSP
ncbi:MAG: hypothetical protein HZB56_16290 [Deltaproteobacteria bacterium]|nr:hypothetical protein [Deltaproteobacteria bacterium]